MKIRVTQSKRIAGLTLPEILVASSVFIVLVSGIVFANLFGLSMFRITATQLDVTDDVRKVMGKMGNEIQTCKSVWIGNVTNANFVALLDGELQQGNGLLIYPGSNPSNFVVYFVNPVDKTFRRTTSTPGSSTILASAVTNALAFKAQGLNGSTLTTLTNNRNNRVIHLNLEFYQAKRFRQVSDYYKVETSVTRRAFE